MKRILEHKVFVGFFFCSKNYISFQFPIVATINQAIWRIEKMKRKLIYRLASLGLAISCALVSIPVEGLSGVLTVYAEEATEPVEPMEEATETVESTEETTEIVEPEEGESFGDHFWIGRISCGFLQTHA